MKAQLAPPCAVIKFGGALVAEPAFLEQLADHVTGCFQRGERVVVVHGGGTLISELQQDLGLPPRKRKGLRSTSSADMRAVTMALRGQANTLVVSHLVLRGVPALGLCGADLALLRSAFLNREKLGRVGGPPRVDRERLRGLLDQGLVPVVAPVCLGPDGGLLNVNADTAAHAVAVALGADTLDFVSDVPGVYTGPDHRVAARLRSAQVRGLLQSGEVRGGMIPKLQASLAAVQAGVGRVRIGDLPSLSTNHATEVLA